MNKPTKNQRLLPLDMLRGIAALSVVLYHYTTRFEELYPGRGLPYGFSIGHVGVHVFFIVSGYVIFWTLERMRKSGRGAVDFMVARFYRLYPVFWVGVLITYFGVALLSLPGREVGYIDAIVNFTMVPRLLGASYVDGVYWSLEVELIFYAWIAALYFLVPSKILPAVVLMWVVLARLVLDGVEQFPSLVLLRVFLIADWIYLFALGMAVYWYRNGVIGVLGLLVFAAFFALDVILSLNIGEAILVAGSFMFILVTTSPRFRAESFPGSGVLLWLGAVSYPLYLIHQNIGYALMLWLLDEGVSLGWVILAVSAAVLIVATLLTYGVEKPIMARVRERQKRALEIDASPKGV